MKIATFKNMKGLIHGKDPKRISAAADGILKIGAVEIPVMAAREEILPLLFHGGTGEYEASFTDTRGNVYALERVLIKGGRIVPPSAVAVELMELRCRADIAEDERDALREEIRNLKNIFDTNSLNFLIK